MNAAAKGERTDIVIGGVRVGVRSSSPGFRALLEARYAGFTSAPAPPDYEFDVELAEPPPAAGDADVSVRLGGGQWRIERGDFRAAFDARARRGRIRQSANPYSIDTLLRIVHTLALAREGGFLVHAASAVVEGRACAFAGPSGAGKTTIARLAPAGVTLLTDEVSYVRREGGAYYAHGTPFAGELATPGENVRAPLAALYLLEKASEHRVAPVEPPAAARALLRNILFFAEDEALVHAVFDAALDFATRVPVRRLAFAPQASAWDAVARDLAGRA